MIGSNFEVSGSLSFIVHNPASVRKADSIIVFGVDIILIGSQFSISSSLGLVLHNASPGRKAKRIMELG
jgi:hypothetical protein